jgi:hypothetical protein
LIDINLCSDENDLAKKSLGFERLYVLRFLLALVTVEPEMSTALVSANFYTIALNLR